jgi:hypothetical protein
LADSVGLALLVVLQTLSPPERLAYVLHDMFDVPFDEIAPIVERSPQAARQLASRARRRVRGADTSPVAERARQREVVDAFLAAAREGDLGTLVTVLDPHVVLRADRPAVIAGASTELRGAREVARRALEGGPHRKSGARGRRRGSRRGATRTAPYGASFYVQRRKDRRDRRDRRPRAPAPARPDGARRLTTSASTKPCDAG